MSAYSLCPCQAAGWRRIRSGSQRRCSVVTQTHSDSLAGSTQDVHISHLDVQYVLLRAWQSGCSVHNTLCTEVCFNMCVRRKWGLQLVPLLFFLKVLVANKQITVP